jgi:cold-inducible RNA-binding protein
MQKVFVGNLNWKTTDSQLSEFFSFIGTVVSAQVVTDRTTGKSRGFGFVEFTTAQDAQRAIEEMDGQDFMGRFIAVNEAKPRN